MTSRWLRNLRRRVRRQRQRDLEAAMERAAAAAETDPCPRCGSRRLCESDCPVAPWNMEPTL